MDVVMKGRRTFYHCQCPDPPEDHDLYIRWFYWHYNNCKRRRIVDVHLPEYEGE